MDTCIVACVYLELVELQCLRDIDQLLHLSHLSHLSVTLVDDLCDCKSEKERQMYEITTSSVKRFIIFRNLKTSYSPSAVV